tara:strand:+ start:11008 stop:11952 length:945 start_codon:yes stop_codon:yes gene_type:complete
MTLIEQLDNWVARTHQHFFKPLIKSVAEYVNILYYVNQLISYIIAIMVEIAMMRLAPLVVGITVPSLSFVLLAGFIYLKNQKPQDGDLLSKLKKGLLNFQILVYGHLFNIIVISILSSICLVISFEVILAYYLGMMSLQYPINPWITLSVTTVVSVLKFVELYANLPIIQSIKRAIKQPDNDVTHSTSDSPNEDSTLNITHEQNKIALHCFNYFVGFTVNSLTVILSLMVLFTAPISPVAAYSIFGSITFLSLFSSYLIYQKQSKNVMETIISLNSPQSLPSADFTQSGTVGADDRTLADSAVYALCNIGALNL